MINKENNKNYNKIAAIRIRGLVRVNKKVKDTLNMLRLYRKNYCVVLNNTPSIEGMLKQVKDFITWGEVDDGTLKLLQEKREEKIKDKGKIVIKKFFRLNPPRGGFGRKGIKKPFSIGGALGYRGDKINDLLRRMV